MDMRRPVDVIYLDSSKAFDTVSHNITIDKLMKDRVDKRRVSWTENQLNCQAQKLGITGRKSSLRSVTSDVPLDTRANCLTPFKDVENGTFSKFAQNWEEEQIHQKVVLLSTGASSRSQYGLSRTS